MTESTRTQLISYIAPSAPATRRPATGEEPFMRPEIGFTPQWYRHETGVDFGEQWHNDPAYRIQSIVKIARRLKKKFGTVNIGNVENAEEPSDILTGTFGASFVASLYGVPIDYQENNWPWSTHHHLSGEEVAKLEPPDLDNNPFFNDFLRQVDWIQRERGRVEGYINWQGVINNAYRIRGEKLFLDMVMEPERARHLFACVTSTMIEGAKRLYKIQKESGVTVEHFTVSNCLVNMVSPDHYQDLLLPCDREIAEAFGTIGVHNCAWNANPYIDHYAELPGLAYVDMGMESELPRAQQAFSSSRRAIMYTPMDVANKSSEEILNDLESIARDYGACDIVFADNEMGTPDERILELVKFCEQISEKAS